MSAPEQIAAEFHAVYERLAPYFAYETRPETAVPWEDLPERNRALMVAVVDDLVIRRIIDPGPALEPLP